MESAAHLARSLVAAGAWQDYGDERDAKGAIVELSRHCWRAQRLR
jgi:hypothetical protein